MQKKENFFLTFVVFLLLSVGTAFLSRQQVLQGVTGIVEIALLPFRHLLFSSFHAIAVEEVGGEVKRLREENMTLRKQLIDQTALKQDNAALHDQYAITELSHKNLLPARIVGMRTFIPGVSVAESIIVDKGSQDGVKKGIIAIYKDNVLGKVASVTPHEALIELLNHPHTSFTVKLAQTNTFGIVKGQGEQGIILDNVVLSDKLNISDIVVTKGDVGADGLGYPPDLVVGKITSIERKPSNLFQTAEIQSWVDIEKLTMVFLMIRPEAKAQ